MTGSKGNALQAALALAVRYCQTTWWFQRTYLTATIGFVVTGYCPDDPANVKCCLSKACTSTAGSKGLCLNTGSGCDGTFVKNRCPGPSDVQCCIAEDSEGSDDLNDIEVVFWINAFIPLYIEGVTKLVPNHGDRSMVVALAENLESVLAIAGCFATDQRSYSSSKASSARMHSEAPVHIDTNSYDWSQAHHCDSTIKLDCDDGSVREKKTADIKGMKFTPREGSSSRVVLDYTAGAGNPFDAFAPEINLVGTLTVDRLAKTVTYSGKVDDFPTFEAYATFNGFGPYTVDTLWPEKGSNPSSLGGIGAKRPFSGILYI